MAFCAIPNPHRRPRASAAAASTSAIDPRAPVFQLATSSAYIDCLATGEVRERGLRTSERAQRPAARCAHDGAASAASATPLVVCGKSLFSVVDVHGHPEVFERGNEALVVQLSGLGEGNLYI